MSRHIETLLVQAGNRKDAGTGAVSLPIHLSTAYEHKGIGQSTGYDYSRTGNPTRSTLEEILAQLEGGHKAYAFSSGMAAVHAVLSLFQSGDELVVSKDLYGGSYRLFKQYEAQYKMKFRFIDTASIEEVEASISPSTRGIFVETPTNPLMNEAPIKEISRVARKHDVLLIVDNTFYTPVIQRPIEEGAHIVIHSATKYLGGHNDVLAGVVVVDSEPLADRIYTVQNSIGATLAPLDCWLLIRGMKTLGLRMKQHESNAKQIASYLESHPSIIDVLYTGKGGMLSFRLKEEEWVGPFLERLELITFAESLGGVESFITYPATQTHADIPEEERITLGICNRLLRFSVGIENAGDLIQDLEQVLTNLEEEVYSHE